MNEENGSSLDAMQEKLRELKKRLMTLEWDKSHNQLNSSMELKFSQIKVEYEDLNKKVEGAKAQIREQETAAETAAAAKQQAA